MKNNTKYSKRLMAKTYKPLTYNYGNIHQANKHSLLGLNMPTNLMQKKHFPVDL